MVLPPGCRVRTYPTAVPIDWSNDITLAQLSNEPELSEELGALYERLRLPGTPGAETSRTESRAFPTVVLNFSQVSFLNSTHIAGLLRLRKRLLEVDRALVLCSLNADVMMVIRHTGLDRVFDIVPDTMTALAKAQLALEQRPAG